jgi:hypothetical protein
MKHRPTATAAPTITTGPTTPTTRAAHSAMTEWARPNPTAFNDSNGNGHTDLAVGAPSADVHGKPRAGLVSAMYGAPKGSQTDILRRQLIPQNNPGISDTAERCEAFGLTFTH